MVKSNDITLPVLIICPDYKESYNNSNLNKIGIAEANDYREGNWYGNSTMDGKTIFNQGKSI